ncbi:hypothetical protein KUTeg_005532 [Tegillarca granosa]|uniref:Major facilitator superfamily (MFS) profile domain-containing protein n=1 Tax=Tegillarca granosa TaxID=220873 RepID=A0ABQ9FK01_TEGGR|nr:hypothetical protein KUTeg_005532 [Tegillarca granosa]
MTKGEYEVAAVDEDKIDPKNVPWWTSSRLGLAVLGFLGFINVYALRVNMSVAIVCMVNRTAIKASSDDNTSSAARSEGCGYMTDINGTTSSEFEDGELVWDKTIQGLILGSFFWGYLVTQIPGGWVATKFGGKRVYGWSMLVATLLTFITPIAAQTSYIFLIVIRIILGVCSGVCFPAMHALWGQWAPPGERSKLVGFTYAGAQVGNVVTFPIAGLLCKYGFAGGWPSIFYVLGILNFIWVIIWLLLVSDSPSTHRRISKIERDYILQTTSNTMHKEAGKNGLYSALPYIVFWVTINFAGWLADMLSKKCWSIGLTRKSLNTFGKVTPAIMLVALGYVDCTMPVVAIVILILGVSLTGFQYSGWVVNHVDIAPPYAGILFGIGNSIASVTGFVSPVIVGVITQDSQTREQWQIVFYIAASFYIFGAIFFVIFGSGDLQSWASQEVKEAEEQTFSIEMDVVKNGNLSKDDSSLVS